MVDKYTTYYKYKGWLYKVRSVGDKRITTRVRRVAHY